MSTYEKEKAAKPQFLKICTWNVKTMARSGKIDNAIQEMERMTIDIMGISEMRWPGTGSIDKKDHRIFYSGSLDGKLEHGVGVIITRKISRCILNFVPVSNRVILLQIRANPVNVNIIQIYAPTADKDDEEVETLYQSIEDILERISKHLIGPFGLGQRNERGDRLEIFAEDNKLVVLNTFYKVPPRRLYTWKAPADKPHNVIRNQIDYILVNRRFRNSFKSVKTYPGADIESDHISLVGVIDVRLKTIKKKSRPNYDMTALQHPEVKKQVGKYINNQVKQLKEENNIQ
ncbi:unnamed protein product, partial [Diabrotica balteata]